MDNANAHLSGRPCLFAVETGRTSPDVCKCLVVAQLNSVKNRCDQKGQ